MAEPVALPAPLPRRGDVFLDPRDGDRALRVSWHTTSRTIVLSLWRGEHCVGTHRLEPEEARRLVHTLVDGLAEVGPATAGAGPA